MKNLISFSLVLFGFSIYGQNVDQLKNNCDSTSSTHLVIDTASKFAYQIPDGWTGEFEGELPRLRLVHKFSGIYIVANEALDSGFDFLERLRKDHPDYRIIEVNGFKITSIYNSTKHQFESYYYQDKFFQTEPWIWKVTLKSSTDIYSQIHICDYIQVISEFTKNDKPKN